MNVQAVDKFHKTRLGYFVFGLVELALAYALANWAFGSGAWWAWVLAFILLFGALQNFVKMLVVRKK